MNNTNHSQFIKEFRSLLNKHNVIPTQRVEFREQGACFDTEFFVKPVQDKTVVLMDHREEPSDHPIINFVDRMRELMRENNITMDDEVVMHCAAPPNADIRFRIDSSSEDIIKLDT